MRWQKNTSGEVSNWCPTIPDLYSNIGVCELLPGALSEDVEFTQKAIALRPQKYDYWGNLADAYRMIPGQTDKASQAYKQAVSLGGKNCRGQSERQ